MSYGLDYEGDMGGMGGSNAGGSPSGGGGHSQGSGRKRVAPEEQTLQSVTISQILSTVTQDSGVASHSQLPDGRNLYHVSFVAAVRGFEDSSTHIMYTMEDGTGGTLQVKQWLDDNSECSAVTELRRECSKEHVYLKVVGQLKDYDGNKMVMADSVLPLASGNQLTHHFLKVVYESEMHKRGGPLAGVSSSSGGMAGFAGSPVMNRGVPLSAQKGQGGGGDNELRQQVLHAFAQDGNGVKISTVVDSLRSRYSEAQVQQEVNYLANEGRIYTTTDDEHYGVA